MLEDKNTLNLESHAREVIEELNDDRTAAMS